MSDQNNSSGHDRWNEEVDSLSPRSRDLVIKDLYGKGQTIVVEDEPGFIGNKINQLDAMLEQVSHEDKTAFLEACKRSPESQSSKSLRLKFLRADKFDAGLAAHRLTQYLDFKRRWFGDEFLDKSITIGDLNEFDLQTLKRGGIQILSKQDEGGRYILFYRNADLVFQSAQNVVSFVPEPYSAMTCQN